MVYVNMTPYNNNDRVATVTHIVSRFALCCMDDLLYSFTGSSFHSFLFLSNLYPDHLWPLLGWNGKIVLAILVGPAMCRQRGSRVLRAIAIASNAATVRAVQRFEQLYLYAAIDRNRIVERFQVVAVRPFGDCPTRCDWIIFWSDMRLPRSDCFGRRAAIVVYKNVIGENCLALR